MVIESEIKTKAEKSESEKTVDLGGRPRLYGDAPVTRRQIRLPDHAWEKLSEYTDKHGKNLTWSQRINAVIETVLT